MNPMIAIGPRLVPTKIFGSVQRQTGRKTQHTGVIALVIGTITLVGVHAQESGKMIRTMGKAIANHAGNDANSMPAALFLAQLSICS